MKIVYPINYSGYIPIMRRILLPVRDKIISLAELGSFICMVMQSDFDQRHALYGTILRDDKQIAEAVNMNPTTIFRHRKNLIESGLLTEEGGLTKITNFKLFDTDFVNQAVKIPNLNTSEIFLIPEKNFSNIEDLIANLKYK